MGVVGGGAALKTEIFQIRASPLCETFLSTRLLLETELLLSSELKSVCGNGRWTYVQELAQSISTVQYSSLLVRNGQKCVCSPR